MNKMKSFVREFAALVTGETAVVQAEREFRRAYSALKSQIASLEGATVEKEDAVSDAEERLRKARVNNGIKIEDNRAYVQKLIEAKNALTIAQEDLEEHQEKLEFLKEQLQLIEEEHEAEPVK